MRTITTTLYEFKELSGAARKTAVEQLREEAFDNGSSADWHDANQTIKQVEEIAHVKCEIQSSSQGYYARWYRNTKEQYDLTDEEEFEQFKRDFAEQFKTGTWADDIMQDLVSKTDYDDRRSYAGNIAWMIVGFCGMIDQQTLAYFEDDYVREYIAMNDFEFTQDGKPYND